MPFQKGQSGNPTGRPAGIPDKRRKIAESLESKAPAIWRKAVALALAGDGVALKIVCDRILPPLKSRAEPLRVNPDDFGDRPGDQAQGVIRAVFAGEISPDTAADVMALIRTAVDVIVSTEVIERLAAIEERIADLAEGRQTRPAVVRTADADDPLAAAAGALRLITHPPLARMETAN